VFSEIYHIHGLINYTDTKAFVGYSTGNSSALLCHPSRRKCIHWQTGAAVAEDTEIAAKKSLM
jgi:hypothetical protein